MLDVFKGLGVEDPKVKVDFSEVKEAEDFVVLPQGFYSTEIIAAIPAITDKKKPIWNMEYKINYGDYKGEIIKDTIYLLGEDEAKTKKAMCRVQAMFSRILGNKIEGSSNPLDIDFRLFVGKLAMVEVEQKPSVKDGKTNYFSNIKFAGFHSISDYSGEMDKDLKYCQGYLDKISGKAEEKQSESATPAAASGGYKF